jgi:hypothetical protein
MKQPVLLATLLGIAAIGFSQDKKLKFGIHGGINVAKIHSEFTYSNNGSSYTSKLPSNSIIGLIGGVHAEVNLGKNFYLQPELSYSQLGAKNATQSADSTLLNRLELKSVLHYLVLPVLVKYKLPKTGASIFIGPQYGYLLGVTNTINSTTINDKDNSNYKSDISGIVGAEYFFPIGLGISARYQLGITNIQKPEYVNLSNLPQGVVAQSISVRNSAFSFTIGYRF